MRNQAQGCIVDMIIPTTLVCVLFDPFIPTSSFNFIKMFVIILIIIKGTDTYRIYRKECRGTIFPAQLQCSAGVHSFLPTISGIKECAVHSCIKECGVALFPAYYVYNQRVRGCTLSFQTAKSAHAGIFPAYYIQAAKCDTFSCLQLFI